MAKFKRRRGAPRPPRHGTRSGYDWHQRRGIRPCPCCRAAASKYMARRRAKPAPVEMVSVPARLFGLVYVNATLAAQETVDSCLDAVVVDRCVALFDESDVV